NIGFEIRGNIKIFDFGLAKELKPCIQDDPGQFTPSGIAGTPGYMAPEVAQILPYGFSADVYSFGILMWEVFALKATFHTLSREKHYKEVVMEGKSPSIVKSWPLSIKKLLERC
ncbi:hypothetical protein ACHAWF_001148, partial [Thalassiosira exigua]